AAAKSAGGVVGEGRVGDGQRPAVAGVDPAAFRRSGVARDGARRHDGFVTRVGAKGAAIGTGAVAAESRVGEVQVAVAFDGAAVGAAGVAVENGAGDRDGAVVVADGAAGAGIA